MIKSIFIFLLAALFLFFEMAIQVSPGIMTQSLMDSFHIDVFWLGLMSGAYFITYTFMQVPAGLFYDKFPAKHVIMMPLLICTVGGFLFALAPNVYLAGCARIFMGFGSAFAFIGVLVVASHVFPAKYFAFIAGITQMLAALGAMCGTLPLVPMIHAFGWRWTMSIISLFGLVLFFLILFFMKLPELRTRKVKEEGDSSVLKGLAIVIKKPQSWVIALYACLLWTPMAVVASLYGAPFVQKYFGLSMSHSATAVLLMWVGIAIGAPVFGFLSDSTKLPRFWLFATSLLGLAAFSIVMFVGINGFGVVCLLFLLAGAACAGQALSFSMVKNSNSEQTQATAIGFNNMAVVIAGFIFQPLVGFVIESNSNNVMDGQHVYNGGDYYIGMLVVFGCYLVSTIIALFFIKPVRR
ncbi:MFS transporter [Francisellaceae bacterium]|nr:MFS transporter [Francisellaceae bacterium]